MVWKRGAMRCSLSGEATVLLCSKHNLQRAEPRGEVHLHTSGKAYPRLGSPKYSVTRKMGWLKGSVYRGKICKILSNQKPWFGGT